MTVYGGANSLPSFGLPVLPQGQTRELRMPTRQIPTRCDSRIWRVSAATITLLLSQMAGRALPQAADSGTATPAAAVPLTGFGRLPHNLSPWNMFTAADIVVQAVMVSLAFASVVTWTILIAKSLELLAARRSLKAGLSVL